MYFDPRLWVFTEPFRGRVWLAVWVGTLSSVLGVARLGLLGWLLGMVFTGAPWIDVVWAAGLVLSVIILRGILDYVRSMVAHGTAARVQVHLRGLLFDKVVALGPAYFGRTRTGDVLVALVDGIEHLEVYFGKYLPQFFIAGLTPVLIFGGLVWIDTQVALVFLLFALITLIAPGAFHKWDSRNSQARAKAYGDFAAEFLDSIQGLATLKVFVQSDNRATLLAEKANELFRTTMWVLATNALARGITDAGIAIGAAAALALGAYRVSTGDMSLEALLIVLMMGVEVFRPLRDLRSLLHEGMMARAAAQKILALLDTEPAILEATEPVRADLAPSIRFEHVRFTYPGGRGAAHEDLDFEVHAGQRIGVVGPSGAGKSSIVRLLLRMYDPDSGRISIGGENIADLSFADLRRRIAVVQQDSYLFHGTVMENLRLGRPQASTAEMTAAARAANAHDFISALPMGYDTVVGERGVRLSGGQRQRIAIARAILRDAPILILDEALSAVDAENEAVIQQALDHLMANRTTLILAHRLSSVIDADCILVLDEGRVVEKGDHASLMAKNGVYRELMAEQAKSAGNAAVLAPPTEDLGDPTPAIDAEDRAASWNNEAAKDDRGDDIISAEGLEWSQVIGRLLSFASPWKGRLVVTFLFGITRVSAFIAVGLVSALVVAALKGGGDFALLLALLAMLAPAAGIFHWLESWLAHDMAFRMLADMRIDLFRKIDSLAPAYLFRHRSGDLVAMATNDVEMVEYFFAHTITPAVVAVLTPTVALFTLGAFHWVMAAVLLPFLAVVTLSPFLLRRRIDELASRDREALGALNAYTVETIQGLSELVANQAEGDRKTGFIALVRRHQQMRLPFFSEMTIQQVLVEVITTLGGLAIVVTGAWLVSNGALTAAYLPLLTLFAMAAFLPVSEIADIGRQLADTLGATRRLHQLDREEPPVRDGELSLTPAPGEGLSLVLENVGFQYEGTNLPALKDVSFTVPAGSTVALVGQSGAGKTTLAHLLLRFWDPQQGRLMVAGEDFRNYRVDDLRRAVSLVAQDTFLFNDTLKANVLMAKPEATDSELAAALERAALSDFVASLPDGLATPVGERGVALSGGQRQRVAIARAFLSDAPVLILDEATSHLDAVNERLVHAALRGLMKNRTTLVIAHRLSTVRDADNIIVLDGGRVAESGPHETLLAQGGIYAGLVNRQLTTGQVAEPSEDQAADRAEGQAAE